MKYFEDSIVVIPFDFSEQSKRALEKTLEWVDSSSRVHLIHVVESSLLVSIDMAAPIPPLFDHEQQKLLLEKLEQMYGTAEYPNLERHCVIGDPGSEITKLAKEVGARLIVMPSHGRTGISRLLLGSVAERVLRLSHCPVLVLRGDGFEPGEEATD